ncbi:hypothetical protein Ocin01_16392 [Orchesella cincta]|uniref:Uncharacterized protein n=1 Tax=Orchesella cincta TaxID=48709 RepID=A0A1D2MBL0_ORCCI|nr:hypothetical protein Ocin01_16392 [Orchesella cincta]
MKHSPEAWFGSSRFQSLVIISIKSYTPYTYLKIPEKIPIMFSSDIQKFVIALGFLLTPPHVLSYQSTCIANLFPHFNNKWEQYPSTPTTTRRIPRFVNIQNNVKLKRGYYRYSNTFEIIITSLLENPKDPSGIRLNVVFKFGEIVVPSSPVNFPKEDNFISPELIHADSFYIMNDAVYNTEELTAMANKTMRLAMTVDVSIAKYSKSFCAVSANTFTRILLALSYAKKYYTDSFFWKEPILSDLVNLGKTLCLLLVWGMLLFIAFLVFCGEIKIDKLLTTIFKTIQTRLKGLFWIIGLLAFCPIYEKIIQDCLNSTEMSLSDLIRTSMILRNRKQMETLEFQIKLTEGIMMLDSCIFHVTVVLKDIDGCNVLLHCLKGYIMPALIFPLNLTLRCATLRLTTSKPVLLR